ncbi:MscL family protein [Candidatus Roizmanbacteria bacterium]|nr:MscL family protein [Candidatus Roizmanbacteria bacterium]
MKGFIEFLRERIIVGFAIGFIMAGAVTKLVIALVTDIINPILGLIFSKTKSLESMYFEIAGAKIKWGDFVSALINFLIISLIVYLLVKGIKKLEAKDKKK